MVCRRPFEIDQANVKPELAPFRQDVEPAESPVGVRIVIGTVSVDIDPCRPTHLLWRRDVQPDYVRGFGRPKVLLEEGRRGTVVVRRRLTVRAVAAVCVVTYHEMGKCPRGERRRAR